MIYFVIMATSFIIALSGALTPGPLLAVAIRQSLKGGFKTGPLLSAGHAFLELILILLLIRGFGNFLHKTEVFILLNLFGGAMLVWMGQGMVRNAGQIEAIKDRGDSIGSPIASGILASLSNPYWSIWWVSVGLTWLAYALPYGTKGIFCFFIGHICADFLWYSFVSFSINRGKSFLKENTYRYIAVGCGFFLISFGLWILSRPFWLLKTGA
jgi:threonine/homoserine/homoserine lactone efflux protein